MHFFCPRDPWTPPGFVLPVPVDPDGRSGPTKARARGPRWRKTGRNLYVPSHVPRNSPEQRIAEAVGHLGPEGGLTGWAALRLRRARYLDGLAPDGRAPRPVTLVMGPHQGRRSRAGIRFVYEQLEPLTPVRGLPCLPAQRAVFDEMRASRRLVDAVVALDMAVLARTTTIDQMVEYVEGRSGWAGVPLVRKALTLADPHSASPPEVRLRLHWQLTMGMPRPMVNVGVFDLDGRLAGYPDLLDLEAGLVIEYDGVDHLPEERRSKDADREGAFRDLGLEVVHVMSRDMRQRTVLTERLVKARMRARFLPPQLRAWSLETSRVHSCPRSCSCRSGQLSGQERAG